MKHLSTSFTHLCARISGTALLAGVCAVPSVPSVAQAPPGLVEIEGGRAKIGADTKEIEKMLEENLSLRERAAAIWAATPEHTMQLVDYYLMVTEVTNEQYVEYVRSTGAKPPEKWGGEAIDVARSAFLEEQGAERQRLKDEGKPLPEKRLFDETLWWNENWHESQWQVPEGTERKPVAYIDYAGARSYARWAGLRLPSEFELQRAARGLSDKDQLYPWGKSWEKNRAATSEMTGVRGTFVVGSFPGGASKDGIHDLIGNVWEWTSSPYQAYPKFKSKTFEFGRKKDKTIVDALPRWDANRRVVFGGSYHSGTSEAVAYTRAGIERDNTADALGFRCAASKQPGVDVAITILEDDLPNSARPPGKDGRVEYEVLQSLAADNWRTGVPAPRAVNAGATAGGEIETPGKYEIISGYDYMIFAPVTKIDAAQKNDIERDTVEEGPIHIGFFTTNQRTLKPDLQPGTYMVALRMAGQVPKNKTPDKKPKEGEEEAPEETGKWNPETVVDDFGLDTKLDNLLFYDKSGAPVGSVPVLDVDYVKLGKGHDVSYFPKDYTIKEMDADGNEIDVMVHEEWIRFDAWIPSRVSRKGFLIGVGLQIEDDLDLSTWRLSGGK